MGAASDYLAPPKLDTLFHRFLWRAQTFFADILLKIGHGSFSLTKQFPGVAAALEAQSLKWASEAQQLAEALDAYQRGQKDAFNRIFRLPASPSVEVGLLSLPDQEQGIDSFETRSNVVYNAILQAMGFTARLFRSHLQEDTNPLPPLLVFEGEHGYYAFPYPGTAPWETLPYPTQEEQQSGLYPKGPPQGARLVPDQNIVAIAQKETERLFPSPNDPLPQLYAIGEMLRKYYSPAPPHVWEQLRKKT
jgi:hypothetical protein